MCCTGISGCCWELPPPGSCWTLPSTHRTCSCPTSWRASATVLPSVCPPPSVSRPTPAPSTTSRCAAIHLRCLCFFPFGTSIFLPLRALSGFCMYWQHLAAQHECVEGIGFRMTAAAAFLWFDLNKSKACCWRCRSLRSVPSTTATASAPSRSTRRCSRPRQGTPSPRASAPSPATGSPWPLLMSWVASTSSTWVRPLFRLPAHRGDGFSVTQSVCWLFLIRLIKT